MSRQDQINELQAIELKKNINLIADSHNELKEWQEYKDWLQHFDNLVRHQELYARNHAAYLRNWEYALGRYRMTKAFYDQYQVLGFYLKYMVDVINPTATISKSAQPKKHSITTEAEGKVSCLVGEKENTVVFINTHTEVAPTGILMNNPPFLLLVAIGICALGVLAVSKKRRTSKRQ